MTHCYYPRALIAVFIAICTGLCGGADVAASRPNVLLVMADDLGYSDLGCYGSEIKTPNLDRLAGNGLRFTQFYNTARCWPTRAALLTGYYAQQIQRDVLPGMTRGDRPKWAPLVASMLQQSGYRTYHSGKWHLDGMPSKAGFDRSYYLKDQGRFFSPQVHYEDDVKLPPVKRGTGFYGTTAVADHAVRCLVDHQKTHPGEPFFHYLAFTAPHFPLHALPEDISKYQGTYDVGWHVLRQQRWKRMQSLGIGSHGLSPVERNVGPPYDFPDALKKLGRGEVNRMLPWHELTEEQHRFQATKMTLHAAMVDRMDQEIGRVLDQLQTMNALDDTLIFFLSDNGASAEIMVRADGHDPDVLPGSAASYLCLGPGWSTVCNTPFRRHKTWVHEGGISTPLIVHWPRKIKHRGALRSTSGHVIDIVPTILDVTNVKLPDDPTGVRPAPPGTSLVAAFDDDVSIEHKSLWWYHEGNRAIRVGKWKLVAANEKPWELYDLGQDRNETKNLALERPELVERFARQWDEEAAYIRTTSELR